MIDNSINIALEINKNMAKTVKISCDNIEYSLETSKDITVLELALENDIDAPNIDWWRGWGGPRFNLSI